MYGVILAGGEGTRLRPFTSCCNKHLLPIGNKLMIQYPIDCFLSVGIKNIVIVTGGKHAEDFTTALSSIDEYKDLNIAYVYQKEADGIVGALKLVEPFIGYDDCFTYYDKFIVMLGDNIIDKKSFKRIYKNWNHTDEYDALAVTYFHNTPEHYGVIKYNKKRKFVERIIEKPKNPPSNEIVIGIYGFNKHVFERISDIKKSNRGEFEITDLLNTYVVEDTLLYENIKGYWYDAGESIEEYHRVSKNMIGYDIS